MNSGLAEAGFALFQTARVNVHGHDAAFVFHGGGQRQRFAARARAVIHNLLARFGVAEQGDQLRTFILNVHPARAIGLAGHEIGFAVHTQSPWAVFHGFGDDAFFGKAFGHAVARCDERVDAQIQRRVRQHGFHARSKIGAEFGAKPRFVFRRAFDAYSFRHIGVMQSLAIGLF